jgi:hypothetical protein
MSSLPSGPALSGEQSDPSMCCSPDGGFVVAWQSRQDGSGLGIFAQEFDPAGESAGVEFQVNSYTTDSQDDARVACARSGRVFVVWESDSDAQQDGDDESIFARIFTKTSISMAPAMSGLGLMVLAGALVAFGVRSRRRGR